MPSKQIKYKLQDVAKDLNVDKTELIELLDKAFPISTARKGQSSLSSDEVGYVLARYSEKYAVKDVMKTFATTKDIRTPKPAEPEKKTARKKTPPKAENTPEKAEAKPAKTDAKPAGNGKSTVKSEKKEPSKDSAKEKQEQNPKRRRSRKPHRAMTDRAIRAPRGSRRTSVPNSLSPRNPRKRR